MSTEVEIHTPTESSKPALFDETMLTLLWEHAGRPGILVAARQVAEAGVARERQEAVLKAFAEQAFRSGGEVAGAAAYSLLKSGVPLDTPISPEQLVVEEGEVDGRKVQTLSFSTAAVATEVGTRGRYARLILAIDHWRSQVWDNAQAIDPDSGRDWYDMALGWIMAHGVTFAQERDEDDIVVKTALAMAESFDAMASLRLDLLALESRAGIVEAAPAVD